MKYPMEQQMPYAVLAVAVLAFFYGIYFIKMLLQKRQGIKTQQIGSRKEKKIHTTETLMSIATVGIVIAQVLSIMMNWNHMPASARFTGFCVGVIGDLFFLISVLCMKDSWRAGIPKQDKTELVTNGIYKFSRNPAFLGFDLQYIGILLLFCNGLTVLFTIFSIVMLHCQILQEEKYLEASFGESYLQYKKSVFRYLGRH